ncbi:MAG: cell division protein ZapB [Spirochaetes bacterium]|nr:MAG: cell division protein ZapB [Spirochaetota bacterium]
MISVEQIHKLESKVLKAVDVIKSLREENNLLKEKLSGYEKRIEELEVFIDSFKQDQTTIEEGILNALNQLDLLEDIVSVSDSDTSLHTEDDQSPAELSAEENSVGEEKEKETPSLENELDIF